MEVPGVGAIRGVFELFVPGAFVVLNALVVLYSALDGTAQKQLRELEHIEFLGVVILICLGYLVGVVLRLFSAEIPDRCSARLNRFSNRDARANPDDSRPPLKAWWGPKTPQHEARFKSWVVEDFPYIEWIRETHAFRLDHGISGSVSEFHKQVWAVQADRDRIQRKTFFNFCKTLINTEDERAASEIYSAEALVRYLVGMFYALLIGLALMATGFASQWIRSPAGFGMVLFPVVWGVYLVMLLVIIRQYRVIRIKEVEIVFSATYRHRELFQSPKAQGSHT